MTDSRGDFVLYFFWCAVVHIFSGYCNDFSKAPKKTYCFKIWCCLFKRVSGADVHSSCRYIEKFLALAQSVALFVIAVERNAEKGHVLDEEFQYAVSAYSSGTWPDALSFRILESTAG